MALTQTFTCSASELRSVMEKTFPADPTRANQTYIEDVAKFMEVSLSSGTPNAELGGGDLVMCGLATIAGGGNVVLDLQSFTDLAERPAQSFARVKFFAFFLPSVAQHATIGTDASSIIVGNGGTNANQLDLGADAHTRTVKNGGWSASSVGTAVGITADATNKDVKILNADGAVAANVLYFFAGGST